MADPPMIHGEGHKDLEGQYQDQIVTCQFCSSVKLSVIKRTYACGCLQSHVICGACGKVICIEDLALCPVRANETIH